ncbi:MAG TPA: hypothetical protein VEJ18_01765 [Planctomycetota bacterium]|nr:hypothetical protein [Planctomycetota bacterium]
MRALACVLAALSIGGAGPGAGRLRVPTPRGAVVQERPWTAWLDDVDSPDPVRAQRALEALASGGPVARAGLLERAAAAEGPRRQRLEAAAQEAGLASENALVPPPRRFSLKAADRPAIEVLVELQARTGLPLELDGIEDQELAPVSVDIRDATPLEALEAVARAASLAISFDPGRIGLSADGHVDAPRSSYGPLLLLLHQYEENRTITFRRKAEASTYLTGELRMEPWVPVLRMGPLRVLEAVDDRGADLRLPADEEEAGPREEVAEERVLPAAGELPSSVDLRLQPLSSGAVRIALLRGYVPVALPCRGSTAVFDAPAEGQKRSGDGYEAEIQSLSAEGQVQVRIRGLKPGAPPGTWVVAVHVEGMRAFARAAIANEDGAQNLYIEYDRPWARPDGEGPARRKSVNPERLELTRVTAVQERRFPFEFRGLKLR